MGSIVRPVLCQARKTFLKRNVEYRRKAECISPGKYPDTHVPHGLKDGAGDARIICSWFKDDRLLNIGIRTRVESGIVILDVDCKKFTKKCAKVLDTTESSHYQYEECEADSKTLCKLSSISRCRKC